MSYLEIPGGIPGFTRSVISLWFRVPQASIDKNVEERPQTVIPLDDPRNVLFGIIPLVTIGMPPTSPRYEGTMVDVKFTGGGTPYPLPILDSPTFHHAGDAPISPSYIGLNCTTSDGKNIASLEFNLQLAGRASVDGVAYTRSAVGTYGDIETPPDVIRTPGSGWESGPSFGWLSFTTIVDNSRYWETQPEHFLVGSSVTIVPDQWHHLLLSFDISSPCITHGAPPDLSHIGSGSSNASTAAGTDNYCRLWYAIDDINYDSSTFDLGPFEVTGSSDLNAILTANAYRVANVVTFLPYNCKPGTPQYRFAAEPIPTARFGIPASAECVDNVYNLEMAEFQMFTGVTLDTSVTANRRAFLDEDGYPVEPDGKPAPAEKLLGTRPVILLHGSSNWTSGKNTGSLGIDSEDKPIPSGQFVRTGNVPSYKPDPSLHGPQSPAPAIRRAGPVRLTRPANARL
jgi:hypothetical protein